MSTREGWAKPIKAKKWHYFDGTLSLCGIWNFRGAVIAESERWEGSRHKDCLICSEQREAREKRKVIR